MSTQKRDRDARKKAAKRRDAHDPSHQTANQLTSTAERRGDVLAAIINNVHDFANYCAAEKIDVETDGDLWHTNPQRAAQDNLRDNDLETAGWRILRFTSSQINEQVQDYCLPKVVENIDKLGGVDEGRLVPRHIDLNTLDGVHQPGLFDEL